ncbi:MAG: hypothetical protein HY675_02760 [Chloroflexi bacterium]|nr:hypothetical protein [Chloroflexota bacterium]
MAARDAAQCTRVREISAQAARELDQWARRYPLIRRVRVWPLAMSVAAAAPFSSVRAVVSSARVSLWVFTLDDVFDEELVQADELMRQAECYKAIVSNGLTVTMDDSLAAALCEVRDDLARYPLFGALGREWAAALCGTIDGMIREYEWGLSYRQRADFVLPSYEEYVANGLYSIGGPPHVWAALVTNDDPSTSRHVEHLRSMERIASTCVRLANDLKSCDKEVSEGKINSLVILSHALCRGGLPPGKALMRAKALVQAHIADGLDQLGELQRAAHTRTGRPEAMVADIARFVCEFYSRHDYHTFLLEAGARPVPSPFQGEG